MSKAEALGESGYLFHLRRGWLLYLSVRHEESVEAYRRASRAEPTSIEAELGLMLPLMARGQWMDALDVADAVLARDAANFLALSRAAACCYELGRYARAEKFYRAVLVLYPADIDLRADLGWSLLRQGRLEEAAEVFEFILHVAPDHLSAAQGQAACGPSDG